MTAVSVVALLLAALALVANYGLYKETADTRKTLASARAENEQLTQTLAEIVDDDGNVRGQLMLPGQVPTGAAIAQLDEAAAREQEAAKKLAAATKKLAAATKKLAMSETARGKVERTLAEAVDRDGTVLVQLRLPGQRVKVNRTPCGLCVHRWWHTEKRDSLCNAAEGRSTRHTRDSFHFEDADGQCVHFKPKA